MELGQHSRLLMDLTGQKFGKLTVIRRGENIGKRVAWLCRCECGNEVTLLAYQLRTTGRKSCGCESVAKAKRNKIAFGSGLSADAAG